MTAKQYNEKLAKRILSKLNEGEGLVVGFEEYAGTQAGFIRAAKDAGLGIVDWTGDGTVNVCKA